MSTTTAGPATVAGTPAAALPVDAARWPVASAGEEAMGRSIDRDEEAFAGVFHAEHGRAMRLGYLLAGDRDAAEDAVAEAFVRTYEKWRDGKIDRVGPYLRQAVVNQVKNQRRSIARLRRHEERKRADERGERAAAEQVAAREAVDDLLAQLPYRQRAALVLRYYEDLSEAEIAEALGCRRGTVKSLISRGMDALRDLADDAELDRARGGS